MSDLVSIGFWLYRLTISRFMIPLCLQIEDRFVDALVCRDHGRHRKALSHPLAARPALDFRETLQRPHSLVDAIDQKAGASILDHLTTRAQIPGDYGNTGSVRFGENQTESLRDRVQVQQRFGAREQFILSGDVERTDVADGFIQAWHDLAVEIFAILDDSGDQE